jgi:hypothetical protein
MIAILVGATLTLPMAPHPVPLWMRSKAPDKMHERTASYNDSIYRIPSFAKDMFGTGVGHAMAYEALVRGQLKTLETKTFDSIDRVLRSPPRFEVDESALSPTFGRRYGSLVKVFEWAHQLHFQTIDVLMTPGWTHKEKEQELERLWLRYVDQPYALTGLPMNMETLDSQPYSANFRKRFPKVNGLFWGYHWLQTVNYDMLFGIRAKDQLAQYAVLGKRYRTEELYKVDREFMPMMAELSPRFAKRFPQIANAFDNLHMLHDNVNDILATLDSTDHWKTTEIEQAIIRLLATTHHDCKPQTQGNLLIHDHRHPPSMPGMGYMKGSNDDVMFMSGMGWMDMSSCAHCSIRLPDSAMWGTTVTANGWTMQVRCAMCARDMAAETPGEAILRIATENPDLPLIMISNEAGQLSSNLPHAVFLEEVADHPECSSWSRAFTSKLAFEKYVSQNPEYRGSQPITIDQWAAMNQGRPATYRKIGRPNPYLLNEKDRR